MSDRYPRRHESTCEDERTPSRYSEVRLPLENSTNSRQVLRSAGASRTSINERDELFVVPAVVASASRRNPPRRPLPPLPNQVVDEVDMANSNNAFPPLDSPIASPSRTPPPAASQVNGNGANYANNYIPPLPVGHQQDLAFLYQQIQELSGLLQSNRDRVNDVTKFSEEVALRTSLTNGHSNHNAASDRDHDDLKPVGFTDGNAEARMRELERELVRANKLIDLYKHEQKENTALIGQYEQGMWHATEQVRDYAGKYEERVLAARRSYNEQLQQERDEHQNTRNEKEYWMAQTEKCAEMIRKAYRLRVDEWTDEYRVVVGLQSEVRCYRRLLGIEPEKPEDETGWPYLKDAPIDDQA